MSDYYIIMEVYLKYPLSVSLGYLRQFMSAWRCSYYIYSTSQARQVIMIPWESYQSIWGSEISQGKMEVIQPLDQFIVEMSVLKATQF